MGPNTFPSSKPTQFEYEGTKVPLVTGGYSFLGCIKQTNLDLWLKQLRPSKRGGQTSTIWIKE